MLSASILGHGIFHSLGNSETFFSKYKTNTRKTDFASCKNLDLSPLAAMLPGVSLRRVPRYARMGLIAAMDAFQKAEPQMSIQNNAKNVSNETASLTHNLGLVIGTAFSSAQMNIDFMDSILENCPHLSSPTAFSHAVNNMGAGLISLLLNIRGGCQTVTQFDLSFAGALQTALLLLHSNKNDYVLLGAIDENDPRFISTCPTHLQSTPYPHTEGAVFFLLGKNVPNTPQISISWLDHIPKADNILFSGDFTDKNVVNNASFYGTTPLAHALDVTISLASEKENTLCVCKQKGIQQIAAINVWKNNEPL